jgi:transposase
VDEVGELIECASFLQNRSGLRTLERWAKRFPERRWAVENAGGLGVGTWPRGWQRPASRWWTCHPSFRRGCECSRVATPARMMGSMPWPPHWLPGATSRAGNGRPRRQFRSAAPAFSERREDLVAERTRAFNRLHGLLRDLVPGGVAGRLSAPRAARILRGIRAQGSSARVRRRLAAEILRDVRALERKIADLNECIEAEVEASGTSLIEIFGIGPILAAKIIGTVGSVARFPTKAHYFASYSGTAPIEASSGEVVRHRLSLAGNRHLNNALHMVAVCQARSDVQGGE